MKKVIILLSICLLCSCKDTREYVCDRGDLAGDKCLVLLSEEPSKICPDGYTLNEDGTKCESKMTIAAKPAYRCSKGYYVGDNKCVSEKIYAQELKTTCVSKNIKEDDKLSKAYVKDDKCYEKICKTVNKDGTCKEYTEKEIAFTYERNCPSGTKQVDGECHKVGYLGKSYSCDLGELDEENKKCIITSEEEYTIDCKEGYTLNKKTNLCEKTITENAYLK